MNLSAKRYQDLKQFIYKLDKGRCHICHTAISYGAAVLDHIIPVNISGREPFVTSDDYWNLRVAHKKCNSRRSNGKLPGQIRLPL